ncbi:MAG TPA: decarboxylating 6-phosphogluconate dehydrogenase [Acidimicrobiales bacterium]|nr:decarboxylating 6-phosphogluconate dehydrogenase [Acidimicrobiales bacterium]
MRLAMIGLGKMGAGMSRRLLRAGHEVVGFDVNPDAVADLMADGALGAESVVDALQQLSRPRVVWLMLPAGGPTQDSIDHIAAVLDGGDVIIDGGNSKYVDSVARAATLQNGGLSFVDVGVSGGVWGLENGFCLMAGGTEEAIEIVRPAFEALAPAGGFAHVGPPGAGHYTKMVHNGIEYGLMQAYAEGFELMNAAEEFKLDLHQVAELWRHGSVVRSWLLDLAERALADGATLAEIQGVVPDSGEGRWTVQDAIDRAVPLPVITTALYTRFATRDVNAFAPRLLAALRNQFGGHAVLMHDEAQTPDPKK